jgi:hypothetical protein
MSTAVESLSEESAVTALESAFGTPDAPEPERKPNEVAIETEAQAEVDEAVAEAAPAEEVVEEVVEESEPEFEIEIDGQPERIAGADRIKEVLQRGIKAQRTHEENARVREALIAQATQQQKFSEFQSAMATDLAELSGLDRQLEQWTKVDWQAAFESDPFKALQLKEQRDQLREARNTKYQEISQKHAQFEAHQKQVGAQRARAEEQALLARIPEWRNAEKATPEKQAIVRDLADHYGFTAEEIGSIVDHRMLLVARDAQKYRELQRTKTDKVKQVRAAPPVVKPGSIAAKQTPKQGFVQVRQHLRKLGREGNHKGQEAAFTELLNRSFK